MKHKINSNSRALRAALNSQSPACLSKHFNIQDPFVIPKSCWELWGLDAESTTKVTLWKLATDINILLVEHNALAGRETQAETIKRHHRRNPSAGTLWWFIGRPESALCFCHDRDGKNLIHRVAYRFNPSAMTLARIQDLIGAGSGFITDSPSVEETKEIWIRTLDKDRLTREFFRGFSDCVSLLKKSMMGGPALDELRHDTALMTMLRLVFVYFLQRRGALQDDSKYILRLWKERPNHVSFYRDVLQPFFFGTLNTPPDLRGSPALAFGDVPYLNGGLFEPSLAESEHPDLDWPDDVWTQVLEGLLERFPFELPASDNEEVLGIDPETMGKVFEGLMYGDARSRSGTFYTPRDVVKRMTTGAIARQLADLSGLAESSILSWADSGSVDISPQERSQLRSALVELRVLDPACGTGAFLLEAAQMLTTLWSVVEGAQEDHLLLRRVIHQHIFGIDIQKTAIRLCELRLWLAILVSTPSSDARRIPPLPNLSHRVVCGNALLSPLDYVLGGTGRLGVTVSSQKLRRLGQKIITLQERWLLAHGPEKAELKKTLDRAREAVSLEILAQEASRTDHRIAELEGLRDHRDMFGDTRGLNRPDHSELERLLTLQTSLKRAESDLENGRAQGMALHLESCFPAALAGGGFDVILTNPPWVRSQSIDVSQRKVLFAKYESASNSLWAGASELGIRPAFGAQVDLANLFLERCLALLKPHGRLKALVPAKMFRSLQGSGIRRVLASNEVLTLEDLSEAKRSLFDATTYPAILECKRGQPASHAKLVLWRGEDASEHPIALPADGAPWSMTSARVSSILARMSRADGAHLQPRRGVFTGLNPVFIRPLSDWVELLGVCVQPYLRRVLTGRDPRGESDLRIFWGMAESTLIRDMPKAVEDYFESHRDRLAARSDYDPSLPLWQIYRATSHTDADKVVWRDMSVTMEAFAVSDGAIPLNTIYFLSSPSALEARAYEALLTSAPARTYFRVFGERARGGWRRHFSWLIRSLPIPLEFWDALKENRTLTEAQIQSAYGLLPADSLELAAFLGDPTICDREAA